jgi:hypothetical protein
MWRLVDSLLRDGILALMPSHPNQHAYMVGNSVETVLHPLVVRVEKALDQQETALGVFLDIEGAFSNTSMLIPTKIDLLHSREEGNSQGSLNHVFWGQPCMALCRSIILE